MKNSKKIIGGIIAIVVIVAIVIAIAISSGMIEKTPAAVKNTVVGEVYGQKITVEQIEQNPQMESTYQMLAQQIQGNLMQNAQSKQYIIKTREEIVQNLELQAIVDKKVQELKLIPTQADMDKLMAEQKTTFFDNIEKQQGIPLNETQYLQMTGMTQDAFNNMIEQQVKAQAVSNYITKDVTATEAEAQTYYNENKATQFTNPATANVYQIVVKTQAEAEKLKAQYESEINGKNLTVAQKLAIFQKIASANNIDSTKETGGLLEKNLPYNYTDFNSNFMKALNALNQNGEVSTIVDSSNSSTTAYNIIFIDNYKAPQEETFDQAKDKAMQYVKQQKDQQQISTTLASWEKEANVKTYTNRLDYPILDSTSSSSSDSSSQSGTEGTTGQSGTSTTEGASTTN
ncbi:MAG: peptidyl-prolyl cis-trans isomerase [Sarcina sp.]